ncbi:uncharacterized protein CLUP02_15713 [Colletotrichum lupini]|uniref:Uncharacterized protein n=1 Tax=Colletotrichum lupini TaxID=145971 RepID=A0A9Q8T788_9PEZI|nr:uncharacterized protein CLUP02_15713 [Colletotrichum lupini]UQC90183.1 hypothetical protein CLUP02_15713 [Colletotrichum lupini]
MSLRQRVVRVAETWAIAATIREYPQEDPWLGSDTRRPTTHSIYLELAMRGNLIGIRRKDPDYNPHGDG